MAEVLWDEIRKKLKENGMSDDEIAELETHIKKNNLAKAIEEAKSEINSLEELIKILSNVKGLEGRLYEHKHQVRYLKNLLVDELLEYWREARSPKKLFRGKDPSKRLSRVLSSMVKEVEESRHRLLSRLKKLLEAASEEKSEEVFKEIETLVSNKDNSKIEELLANFPSLMKRRTSMLKKRDLRNLFAGKNILKELGPYEVTENTLDNLLLHMEAIESYRRQLSLIGLNYIKVEEFSSIEENLAYAFAEYRGRETYLKLNAPFDYMKELKEEEEELFKLGKELISLDIKFEKVKEDLANKLAEKGLSKHSEMVKLIGVNRLKPPLTLYCPEDIEVLKKEVSKLQGLNNLLKELLEELTRFPGKMEISLIDVPTSREEEFIRGFINALKISRLSEGLPIPSYSFTGVVNTVLDLYPKWRKRVMETLIEKGSMPISELNFIPEIWREWFLSTLKDEGAISISDDKIVIRTPAYELLEKVKTKIEILRDSLADLGTYVGQGLTEELVNSYLNELERAKELMSKGSIEKALSILKGLDSKLNKHLSLEAEVEPTGEKK